MQIRELKKSDYLQFVQLIDQFRPIGQLVSEEKFEEMWELMCINSTIFVTEHNHEIVATAKLMVEQKLIHNLSRYGSIEDVMVKQEYRHQKIGAAMIKHIVDHCQQNNFYKVNLTCTQSLIPFYQRNHFEVSGVQMSYVLKKSVEDPSSVQATE
jgi:glucosamine-phosphate N-acetyltransferase